MPTTDELLDSGLEKVQQGDHKGAIEDWTQAIELDDTLVLAYTNRGTAKQELNDLKGALADFDRALELDKDNANAYLGRANVFARQNLHKQAMAELDKLIVSHPDDAVAYYNRGNSHLDMSMGQIMRLKKQGIPKGMLAVAVEKATAKAFDDYSKAIELMPDMASAYSNRSRIYMLRENTQEALTDINKAIELQPDNPNYYMNRGSLYVSQQQAEPALADYDKALELNPKNPDAWSLKGTMLHQLNRNPEAVEAYNQSLRIQGNRVGDLMNRGIAYRHLGEYEKGLTDLNKVIELARKNSNLLVPLQLYRNRANIYEELGNKDLAVQDYETYLKIGGGHHFGDQAEIAAKIKELKKPKWKFW